MVRHATSSTRRFYAGASTATLDVMGPVLAVGAAVLLPSLYWLMRLFHLRRSD